VIIKSNRHCASIPGSHFTVILVTIFLSEIYVQRHLVESYSGFLREPKRFLPFRLRIQSNLTGGQIDSQLDSGQKEYRNYSKALFKFRAIDAGLPSLQLLFSADLVR